MQKYLFNFVLEKHWPGLGLKPVLTKALAVNFVCDPLLFFPLFYVTKEICNNGEAPVTAGLSKYSQNYWTDWTASWSIWIPAHSAVFAVAPLHLRMPAIACVSFGYLSFLSCTRGAYKAPSDEVPVSPPLSPPTIASEIRPPASSSALPRPAYSGLAAAVISDMLR